MLRIIFMFLLFVSLGNAQTATVEIGRDSNHRAVILTYSAEWSLKHFSQKTGIDIPDGTVVYASTFHQEEPDTIVFRPDMTGVYFVRCNLNNVFIPPGNTIRDSSQRRYRVQNDLRDWEIDSQNRPTRLINAERWFAEGYSIDPVDIPDSQITNQEDIPRRTIGILERVDKVLEAFFRRLG